MPPWDRVPHAEALGLTDPNALPLGRPVEALGWDVRVPLPLMEEEKEGEGVALWVNVALRELFRQPLALGVPPESGASPIRGGGEGSRLGGEQQGYAGQG